MNFPRRLIAASILPIMLLLALAAAVNPATVAAEPDSWQEVIPGVEYKHLVAAGPNQVYVARMDRSVENLIVESAIGQGKLSGGTERMTDMYARYDQAINYWDQSWGSRNRVAVAINGFFYGGQLAPPGVPHSGQVHSGWYAKRFDEEGSGFSWKLDRSAFIGECLVHKEDKNFITHVNSGLTRRIDGINLVTQNNGLYLYTPQFDAMTGTGDSDMELLLELSRPALLIPPPNQSVVGHVREILDLQGDSEIPFDHLVLSVRGPARNQVLNMGIQIGDEIKINQQITDYKGDCSTVSGQTWTKAYAGIGGFPVILRDGVIPDFEAEEVDQWSVRHPRTAVAYNDEYIFFIVVDGRNPGISVGMNYEELALFARDTLGADWAINEDGGGSSTMVVNGRVVNNTYCNHVDCTQTAAVAQAPPAQNSQAPTAAELQKGAFKLYLPVTRRQPFLQRLVANGLLMVAVEPMDQSVALSAGASVVTVADTTVRLGPGTNYQGVATIGPNTSGVVLDHANGLDGVRAKGSYWWKVAFGNSVGWVQEEFILNDTWDDEARLPIPFPTYGSVDGSGFLLFP